MAVKLYAAQSGAVIVLIADKENFKELAPAIKIIKYGIGDERVNQIIVPEIRVNKIIYRFDKISNNTVIQFTKSENLNFTSVPIYFLCHGDSVIFTIDNCNIKFTGIGSDKYECLYNLKQLEDTYRKGNNINNFHIDQNLVLLDLQENLLKTYKNKLDKSVFKRILNEIRLKNQITNYTLLRHKRKEIIDVESTIRKMQEANSKIDTVGLYYYFPSYFLGKYIYEIQKYQNRRFDFNEAFDYLNTRFTGIIREQLITYLVKTQLRSSTISSEQLFALNAFKNTTLKSYVQVFIKGKTAGIYAPPFSLTAIDGKRYSLNDFSGKVLILDFWFTGCGACKLIPPILGPLAEKFKDEEDVVFLSISIDKDSEQWKASVRNGGYTFNNSIKLYTNGLGVNDNIIKNYYIEEYPTIIGISRDDKILPIPINPRFDKGRSLEKIIIQELNNESNLK